MARTTIDLMIAESETSPLARHFAALLARLAPHDPPLVAALATRLLAAGENGDVCLDLSQEEGSENLIAELRQTVVVGRAGEWKPLILDEQGRLYLYRQWLAEHRLAAELRRRGEGVRAEVDLAILADGLRRLFPLRSDGTPDEQALAAATAVLKPLSVISGGPGTGKTTTVVKVLALLLEQAMGPLRIALTAPTGKAAARLRESISRARADLPCDPAIRDAIPQETSTLHRLLGANADATSFRYGTERQLRVDVAVVDEASMVNLSLMQQLVSALPEGAQLIILGDHDQLASVEAGAVLADLCGEGEGRRSSAFVALLTGLFKVGGQGLIFPATSTLADAIVTLRESRRFDAKGAIGTLCKRLNDGDGAGALDLLRSGEPQVQWCDLSDPAAFIKSVADAIDDWITGTLAADSPQEALSRFGNFMLLTALRQGPLGSIAMNQRIEELLIRRKRIDSGKLWYAGRPVMITRNAPGQELFNGDIGLTLLDPAAEGALRVFFPSATGELRALSPLTLPAHETAFAMTVHKSQGSEFSRILLLLPGQRSNILTRELLYTAVSRARDSVQIYGEASTFVAAAAERVVRSSGLRAQLWDGI